MNRVFLAPDPKLHPAVFAIKALINQIQSQFWIKKNPIIAYIDFHAHSHKKSIFLYGPFYPLHNNKYFKVWVFAKLLSENNQMFRLYFIRYHACKFRNEKCKRKSARIVLSKEFNIMNCFTLESSYYAFINKERETIELKSEYCETTV